MSKPDKFIKHTAFDDFGISKSFMEPFFEIKILASSLSNFILISFFQQNVFFKVIYLNYQYNISKLFYYIGQKNNLYS